MSLGTSLPGTWPVNRTAPATHRSSASRRRSSSAGPSPATTARTGAPCRPRSQPLRRGCRVPATQGPSPRSRRRARPADGGPSRRGSDRTDRGRRRSAGPSRGRRARPRRRGSRAAARSRTRGDRSRGTHRARRGGRATPARAAPLLAGLVEERAAGLEHPRHAGPPERPAERLEGREALVREVGAGSARCEVQPSGSPGRRRPGHRRPRASRESRRSGHGVAAAPASRRAHARSPAMYDSICQPARSNAPITPSTWARGPPASASSAVETRCAREIGEALHGRRSRRARRAASRRRARPARRGSGGRAGGDRPRGGRASSSPTRPIQRGGVDDSPAK